MALFSRSYLLLMKLEPKPTCYANSPQNRLLTSKTPRVATIINHLRATIWDEYATAHLTSPWRSCSDLLALKGSVRKGVYEVTREADSLYHNREFDKEALIVSRRPKTEDMNWVLFLSSCTSATVVALCRTPLLPLVYKISLLRFEPNSYYLPKLQIWAILSVEFKIYPDERRKEGGGGLHSDSLKTATILKISYFAKTILNVNVGRGHIHIYSCIIFLGLLTPTRINSLFSKTGLFLV